MDALSEPAKMFYTSGKSAALLHHHAICKLPMALPDNGRFGAIAGQKSFRQLKLTGSPQKGERFPSHPGSRHRARPVIETSCSACRAVETRRYRAARGGTVMADAPSCGHR